MQQEGGATEVAQGALEAAAQVATVASQLPLLEPLCGIALAFNLAYLNLKMFRYRDQLAKAAKKTLKRLGGEDPTGHLAFTGFAWFWNACILAKDDFFPCDDKTPSNDMVNRKWHKSLRFWFDSKADVLICVGFCLLSGFLLVAGVAQSLGWWISTNWLGQGWVLKILFGALVTSIIAPTFFVWRGKMVVDHGKDYLSDQVENEANLIGSGVPSIVQGQQAALAAATTANP